MSNDEQALIVGRMLLEEKELQKTHLLLHQELHRIGEGLQRLGRDLTNMYSSNKTLSTAERELLDQAKVENLVNEMRTVNQRLNQLRTDLSKL